MVLFVEKKAIIHRRTEPGLGDQGSLQSVESAVGTIWECEKRVEKCRPEHENKQP